MRFGPAFGLVCAVLVVACGESRSSAPVSGTPAPTGAPATTRFGVAGVIPPHYPQPESADYARLFDSFSETGTLVGVYLNWADSDETEGAIPRGVASLKAVAADRHLQLAVALGTVREGPAGVRSTVDWGDAAQRGRFLQAVGAVAREVRPAYLAIGVEVNRLWEADPAAFAQFVAGYREAYAVAKQASPSTQVFTVFQLEMLKGGAFLMGGSEERQPEWDLLAQFDGALDLLGLTSYPFLDFQTPAEIPAGYYTEAAERSGKAIALTELGWPSRPLSSAPASGYGGAPAEQVEFLGRLPALLSPAEVQAVLWSFPYDLGSASPVPTFESVALRENDGTAKPALEAWRAFISR